LLLLGASAAQSLELPLTKGTGKQKAVIAFVDMELIFQEFPDTQKAKLKYHTELQRRREDLSKRDTELLDLRQQLAVLESTLTEMQSAINNPPPPAPVPEATVSTETATPPADSFDIEPSTAVDTPQISTATLSEGLQKRKKDLEEKEKDLEKARVEAVQSLKDIEEKKSLQIFGELYRNLVQLAQEEGITLVLDKSNVLYGETAIDLTEKLRRRIRGLPPPEQENP